MESANKDEALRCLEKAKTALADGDIEKAKRLTDKSLRLCATHQAKGTTGSTSHDDHLIGMIVYLTVLSFLSQSSRIN